MNKLTIYIVRHRYYKNNSGHSEPCSNCLQKIKQVGIKKIVYVGHDGKIIKCKTKNYHTDYICPGYRLYHEQNLIPD
jgi:deoxycytidylate deaminase